MNRLNSSKFAVRLVQKLYREQENLVVSPFVVLSGLAVLLPGADGDTRAELLKTLFGLDKSDPDVASDCVGQFARSLSLYLPANKTISIANMAYFKQGAQFADAYKGKLFEQLKVKASFLDFANKETAEAQIIDDIRTATKGKMPDVKVEIDPHDCLVLMTAIDFTGEWEQPFNKLNTKIDGDFNCDDGRVVKTPMMSDNERKGQFFFDPATNTKAVRLWYSAKYQINYRTHLSMVLILPGEGVKLADYLRSFSGTQLDHILGNCTEVIIKLKMPRFTMHGDHSLESALKDLGLKESLDHGKANFRNISSTPLCISKMKQSAMIEVDERGIKTAPFTSKRLPPVVEFIADRPFLYVVETHSEPKQILFIGTVAHCPAFPRANCRCE